MLNKYLIPERYGSSYKSKIDFELNLFDRQVDLAEYLEYLVKNKTKCKNTQNSWVAWAIGVCDEIPSGEMEVVGYSLADADLDLSNRDLAIDYVRNKYGDERVALVGSFAQIKTKNALKDIRRDELGGHLPNDDPVHVLCKSIPQAPQSTPTEKDFLMGYTDDDGVVHGGYLEENKELNDYLEGSPAIKDKLFKILEKPRSMGIHASGVVITPGPVDEVLPTRYDSGGFKITQIDGKTVEKMGGVKFDFLGLRTLTYITQTIKLIKGRHGIELDQYNLPPDVEVFRDFQTGNVDSVFQFNTDTVLPYLLKIKPDSIKELSNITALCRPGALNSKLEDGKSVADHYVLRRSGLEPVVPIDPIVGELLRDTYQLPLFQEQTIKIFEVVGGLTPQESDTARRAVGKKNLQELISVKGKLFEGAQKIHGWTLDKCELLWGSIIGAAEYQFNISHSFSYSLKAYACAYLKHHFPLEWWCSVLTYEPKDDERRRWMSINMDKIDFPHVNKSTNQWEIKNDRLVAPMTLVDGVGPVAIENIRKAAPYVSFIDFIKRAEADKTVVVNLIWAGAFDNFPLEDGGVPVIDDPEKLFYAYFKSRHTLKRKEFQIEPEYANIDRVKKIINKVRVLPIVDYDYVLEFNDFLKRNNSYTFDNKVHYWNKKPVIRDFSRFEEVRKYWAGDVALIGIVASAVEKTYMDKKKNVEVKRIILTLENKGKTTDIILWDRMLQKISADDYRPGGLVALSGELRYDSYAHAIRLGCKRVERIM